MDFKVVVRFAPAVGLTSAGRLRTNFSATSVMVAPVVVPTAVARPAATVLPIDAAAVDVKLVSADFCAAASEATAVIMDEAAAMHGSE